MARGGPRDLANLRDGVKAARGLRDSLKNESLSGEALSAKDSSSGSEKLSAIA